MSDLKESLMCHIIVLPSWIFEKLTQFGALHADTNGHEIDDFSQIGKLQLGLQIYRKENWCKIIRLQPTIGLWDKFLASLSKLHSACPEEHFEEK